MPGPTIAELAATLGTTPDLLRDLLRRTLDHVPRPQYYVFRITGGQQTSPAARSQPRMIAAFPTPDDALGFAQRNGYGSNAQLRAIAAAELVARMLADATIGSILFLAESGGSVRPGFGPGLKVSRSELLQHLRAEEPAAEPGTPPEQPPAEPIAQTERAPSELIGEARTEPIELSAEQYDALLFGVNFTRRAEFRVALAQAIEQIVASYQPPPGSVDLGPRSIFAATEVELWLRRHGFPHAEQRRWIDVAGEPGWGGAVELCELDGGTANRLLIQLLIHLDETGRQYIKHVNVTA